MWGSRGTAWMLLSEAQAARVNWGLICLSRCWRSMAFSMVAVSAALRAA